MSGADVFTGVSVVSFKVDNQTLFASVLISPYFALHF